jgi:hypothetical protein
VESSVQNRDRVVPENMERETGIEPATNSLEGCDSTIELLPLLESTSSAGTRSFKRTASNEVVGVTIELFIQVYLKGISPISVEWWACIHFRV